MFSFLCNGLKMLPKIGLNQRASKGKNISQGFFLGIIKISIILLPLDRADVAFSIGDHR